MPRRANAKAGKALPQVHDDLLGKFTRHRQFNRPIARELMLDTGTREIGQKIANCAHTLKADLLIHPDMRPEVNLKAARVLQHPPMPFLRVEKDQGMAREAHRRPDGPLCRSAEAQRGVPHPDGEEPASRGPGGHSRRDESRVEEAH